ncbi:hypothetical protein L3Q82_003408 [Scortum barcoo]|uniref:Uncharacterized protein n=1 Tax=Scortum barcoo TaxID=214431 RepID=A0ACB8VMJ1_9TELE|nr:hypothetical protein L3Q82_003408 [Scortum barcoo]
MPDVEVLLLREFSAVFLAVVYIAPRANSAAALGTLHDIISAQETAYPDATFIIGGDFNHCNLQTVLPKFYQHVNIPTREQSTLDHDHVCTNIWGANKAPPAPTLDISVFLYPAYRQRLKQTNPVNTQIKRWTPDTESILQDCFAQTDWDVFKAAATQEDSSINECRVYNWLHQYLH